jgi:hypothetical protein
MPRKPNPARRIRGDTLCRCLFTRVVIDTASGCWNFTSSTRGGYGRLHYRGRMLNTHRVVWEMWNGPVPDGLQLHHECANKGCCNPGHLAAVTAKEHYVDLTPRHITYTNARKTHCPAGHPFVSGNLANSKDGRRRCLACRRETRRTGARPQRYLTVST